MLKKLIFFPEIYISSIISPVPQLSAYEMLLFVFDLGLLNTPINSLSGSFLKEYIANYLEFLCIISLGNTAEYYSSVIIFKNRHCT